MTAAPDGKMTGMRLSALVQALESYVPTRWADAWDNVGLLAGDPGRAVQRVLLCVDYTADVATEGRTFGAELVIAYHPPIFDGLKRIVAGSVLADAVRRDVALWSPHTAFDVAVGGTNDLLADIVGIAQGDGRAPIAPLPPPAPAGWGHGRIGAIPKASRGELLDRIKRELALTHLLVAGPLTGHATKVAVAAGSGGGLLGDALDAGAHVFVTGELRHHDALRAAREGATVACTLHSNSERAALPRIARRLQKDHPELTVKIAKSDRDPFVLA